MECLCFDPGYNPLNFLQECERQPYHREQQSLMVASSLPLTSSKIWRDLEAFAATSVGREEIARSPLIYLGLLAGKTAVDAALTRAKKSAEFAQWCKAYEERCSEGMRGCDYSDYHDSLGHSTATPESKLAHMVQGILIASGKLARAIF